MLTYTAQLDPASVEGTIAASSSASQDNSSSKRCCGSSQAASRGAKKAASNSSMWESTPAAKVTLRPGSARLIPFPYQ